jgi:hypothetical protein
MIVEDMNDMYKFECSGRMFSTHGTDGLSFDSYNRLRYGYDGLVALKDDEGFDDSTLEPTQEEKKELALYMVHQWLEFAELPIEDTTVLSPNEVINLYRKAYREGYLTPSMFLEKLNELVKEKTTTNGRI